MTLEEKFLQASKKLGEAVNMKSRGISHENNYNSAYKALMMEGKVFKLKQKYMR